WVTQTLLQGLSAPRSSTVAQAPAAGQLVGQAPSPAAQSRRSAGRSTMPCPHRAGQSVSTLKSAPLGQQPSPARGAVMGSSTQVAAQVPALMSRASVQPLPPQLVG